jgi:uncharacterized membrane protein
MMKKCPRCGLTFSDDIRYCTSCGSPLEDVVEQVAEPSEPTPDEENVAEPQPNSSEQPSDENPQSETSEQPSGKQPHADSSEQPHADKEPDFEQKAADMADDLSEALGELGAAAKKVFDKIGDKAKEGYEKLKEDETFNKYSDKAQQGFEKVMDTPDSTSDYDPADVENNKIIALFAYLGILFIVPLIAGKDSRYARFHANQGIILFICSFLITTLSALPTVGWVFAVCHVLVVILVIYGIINAVTGKARELPVIGKFRILR